MCTRDVHSRRTGRRPDCRLERVGLQKYRSRESVAKSARCNVCTYSHRDPTAETIHVMSLILNEYAWSSSMLSGGGRWQTRQGVRSPASAVAAAAAGTSAAGGVSFGGIWIRRDESEHGAEECGEIAGAAPVLHQSVHVRRLHLLGGVVVLAAVPAGVCPAV